MSLVDVPTLVEDRRLEEEADEDFIEIESLDKTHDPVRLYLREMGSVPLLNREGEIGIARRIERGQTKTRRILSRCPVIIQEMVRLGEDVRCGRCRGARHSAVQRSDSDRRDL